VTAITEMPFSVGVVRGGEADELIGLFRFGLSPEPRPNEPPAGALYAQIAVNIASCLSQPEGGVLRLS
jgi:hypothetical protein